MVRKAKPNLVDRAMRTLLPEFVGALEPFYASAQADPDTHFRDHLMANQTEVADALLAAGRAVDEPGGAEGRAEAPLDEGGASFSSASLDTAPETTAGRPLASR